MGKPNCVPEERRGRCSLSEEVILSLGMGRLYFDGNKQSVLLVVLAAQLPGTRLVPPSGTEEGLAETGELASDIHSRACQADFLDLV